MLAHLSRRRLPDPLCGRLILDGSMHHGAFTGAYPSRSDPAMGNPAEPPPLKRPGQCTEAACTRFHAAAIGADPAGRYLVPQLPHDGPRWPHAATPARLIVPCPAAPAEAPVPSGPIGRDNRFADGDIRATIPRFSERNRDTNQALLHDVRALASSRSATPGQVALAWLLAQHPSIGPIPGTRSGNGLTWHSFSPRNRGGLTYSPPGALALPTLLVCLRPGHQCRPDGFFSGTLESGVDQP